MSSESYIRLSVRIVCSICKKNILSLTDQRAPSNTTTVTTNMDGLPEFYELHLILLSIVCLLSLLADRYSKKNRKLRDVVDERLGSSSLATLTRQYLVVYAIVMGSSTISLS